MNAYAPGRTRDGSGPAHVAATFPPSVALAPRAADGESGWAPWSPAERESFFDAIARHRRASWRITAACAVAVAVLAVVVAALLSPLLVCTIGLAADLLNLVVPMPDLLGIFGNWIDPLFSDSTFSVALAVEATAVAALPGLIVMAVALFALTRALKRSPLFAISADAASPDGQSLPGRAPTRAVLAEHRLLNVVEEMALAASIPLPQVRIIPGGINAAVFGRDDRHTTILVGEGLVATLDRAQMQGAIAHLIGSIAGGDMPIGLRAAVTFALFGLLARLSGCLGDRREFHTVARIVRALAWPSRARSATLVRDLADPFAPTDAAERAHGAPGNRSRDENSNALTWREWLMMPLMGPVVMAGFVSGIVSTFLLNPLVSFAWRRRKYMADAAAVRLTRDPDTLATALRRIIESGNTGLSGWTVHMGIAQGGARERGLLGGNLVSIFPSPERRYRALGAMGAALRPLRRSGPAMPTGILVLVSALGSVAGALMAVAVVLIIWLSFALSGLFTIMPAAALHALLRWMGH